MLIPFRPCPDSRERHHVGEIQRRHRRLADIGVDVAGETAEPRLNGVDRLAHAGEVAALHSLFDQALPFLGNPRISVPNRNGGGDVGLADKIGTELLQCGIGIQRLVGGVAVHQHRRLVGHHLLQDRHDRFAFGEPLAADAAEHFGGVGLVQADRPC